MSGRIDELDIAKGLGIMHVLAGHFLILANATTYYILVYLMCGSATMILFFLAAGYTYRPGRTPGQNIKKRLIAMFKPFIIYSVIITALLLCIVVICGKGDFSEFLDDLYQVIAGKGFVELVSPGSFEERLAILPGETYWFLRQMAVSGFIYFLLVDMVLDKVRNLIIVEVILFGCSYVMCAFCPQLPWDFGVTPSLAGYLLIGAWCGRHEVIQRFREKIFNPVVIILSIIMAAGSLYLSTVFPWGQGLARGYYSTVLPHGIDIFEIMLVTALAMLPLMWICCLITMVNILSRIFGWIGKNSMSIYLIHYFIGISIIIIAGLDSVIFEGEDIPNQTLVFTGVYLGMLVLSLVYAAVRNKVVSAINVNRRDSSLRSE